MPSTVRRKVSSDLFGKWFRASDFAQADGRICVTGFFKWTMTKESMQGRITSSLEHVFDRYDGNASGFLDSAEFDALAEDLGFGAVGVELFMNLDMDKSGMINYHELLSSLQHSKVLNDYTSGVLLHALMEHDSNRFQIATDQGNSIGWWVQADDVDSLRTNLREHLDDCGMHVADLIELFYYDDADYGHDRVKRRAYYHFNERSFMAAMRERLGYRGDSDMLHQIFVAMDRDGSGHIDREEIFEFVLGRPNHLHRGGGGQLKVPRGMRLKPKGRYGDDYMWTLKDLRRELVTMMIENRLAPHDLFRAWDRDGTGVLGRREVLSQMKRLIIADDGGVGLTLWYCNVRAAVFDFFEAMSRKDGTIQLVDFTRWIQEGYYEEPEVDELGVKEPNAPGRKLPSIERRRRSQDANGPVGRHSKAAMRSSPSLPALRVEMSRSPPLTRRLKQPQFIDLSPSDRRAPVIPGAAMPPNGTGCRSFTNAKPVWHKSPTTPLYVPRQVAKCCSSGTRLGTQASSPTLMIQWEGAWGWDRSHASASSPQPQDIGWLKGIHDAPSPVLREAYAREMGGITRPDDPADLIEWRHVQPGQTDWQRARPIIVGAPK